MKNGSELLIFELKCNEKKHFIVKNSIKNTKKKSDARIRRQK
jgi:hypothetical protein